MTDMTEVSRFYSLRKSTERNCKLSVCSAYPRTACFQSQRCSHRSRIIVYTGQHLSGQLDRLLPSGSSHMAALSRQLACSWRGSSCIVFVYTLPVYTHTHYTEIRVLNIQLGLTSPKVQAEVVHGGVP